jgi:hypothetical protein
MIGVFEGGILEIGESITEQMAPLFSIISYSSPQTIFSSSPSLSKHPSPHLSSPSYTK